MAYTIAVNTRSMSNTNLVMFTTETPRVAMRIANLRHQTPAHTEAGDDAQQTKNAKPNVCIRE